jgi:hypothetical protein
MPVTRNRIGSALLLFGGVLFQGGCHGAGTS